MTSSGPSVARTVADLRRPPPAPVEDARQYVNLWREAEALGGDRVRAMVLILRTRGCYWADLKGCTMCGYARDTLGRSATPEEIREQLARALRQHQGEPYVKIYTSRRTSRRLQIQGGRYTPCRKRCSTTVPPWMCTGFTLSVSK